MTEDPTAPRGPDLAEAVAAVLDVWTDPTPAGQNRRGFTSTSLQRRLDALARAAGREVPQ